MAEAPVAAQANLKRVALEDQPRPGKLVKRTFGDITNAMTNNLVIDSSKKNQRKLTALKPGTKKALPTRRSRGTKEEEADLPSISEDDAESPESMEVGSVVGESSRSSTSSDDDTLPTPTVAVVDPCPGFDYDEENAGDPFNVPDYARGIFLYLKTREEFFRATDYMSRHPRLSREMRAILVDWMVEVQENFELNHETLYLGVKLTDLFLSRTTHVIPKQNLQLVGSTALLIAAKYEERMAPCLDDFLYICDDAYTKEDLLDMEQKLLNEIDFQLGIPLSYRFLRRFAKVTKASMDLLTLARYVLETSLMHYEFLGTSEWMMAAAAFLLALRMKRVGDWTAVLVKYTGLEVAEVEPLMWKLNAMLKNPGKDLKNVKEKYSHEVFFEVASIPPLA
jgi:cyclin B